MKSFLIGLLLEVIIIITSIITKNEKIFICGTQILGLGSIGIGAILSGMMGDNIYRKTAVEDRDERFGRLDRTTNFVLLGIPSIVTLIIYYFFIV